MTLTAPGWRTIPLVEAAEVTLGQSPPGDSYNDIGAGIPFFQGKADFTATVAEVRKFTTAGTKFAKSGDILVSVRAPVGPSNLAPVDCAIGRGLAALRARTGIDQRYLFWAMRATEAELAKHGAGSTFAAVTGKQLKAHPVAIAPTLDQQRRIVELLEDHLSRLEAADGYLSAARRRLKALERSALDAHFGGTDVPLSELVADISAGKSFGGANAPAADGEWGIIKVSAMTWGQFAPTENKAVASTERVDRRFEIREGDLLVSRANTSDYVGASVLVRDVRPQLLLSDKSLRVRARSGVDVEWLWRALQAPSARRQISALATGTKDSMRNISQAALKRVLLPNVSTDEQTAALQSFNAVADAVTLLRREVATGAHRLEDLRRSLLAAAFSGRLTGAASDLSEAEEMIGA